MGSNRGWKVKNSLVQWETAFIIGNAHGEQDNDGLGMIKVYTPPLASKLTFLGTCQALLPIIYSLTYY